MNFLKALRKSDDQKPESKRERPRTVPKTDGKFGHVVPELVNDPNLRIGVSSPSGDDSAAPVGKTQALTGRNQLDAYSFSTVSVDEARVNRHLVAITDPRSAFCEEYRSLRATLLQKGKKQKLRTIAVVSAVPSEGKSITALNLAWLIAQTDGISALVIDCDLRLPSLTKYLGLEPRTGLSDILDGVAKLEDTIIRLEPSGLHLLPGGGASSDVAEQFSSPMFAGLLAQVQDMFDFVIMDAPPLGVFADAKVLMDQADSSILVVRSNYTKFKDVNRILEGISEQRILGVVLNQSDETSIGGKYYDYPYYQYDKSRV